MQGSEPALLGKSEFDLLQGEVVNGAAQTSAEFASIRDSSQLNRCSHIFFWRRAWVWSRLPSTPCLSVVSGKCPIFDVLALFFRGEL